MQILIIDDEANIRRTTTVVLEGMGHQAIGAKNSDEALAHLGKSNFDVAFLDLKLGEEQGLTLLPQLLAHDPRLNVVVFTAYASIETAVEAMRRGASDYVAKPFTPRQIQSVLDRIAHSHKNPDEPVWEKISELAVQAAASPAPVLLLGERGTGKTVLARFIHQKSAQRSGPFVRVCCPRWRSDRLAATLFGDRADPASPAHEASPGKVALAEGGLLFLEEIGVVPLDVQSKILQLLKEQRYQRSGEQAFRPANVRLIAATLYNLEQAVADGRFEADLLACLQRRVIHLPPLRERQADLLKMAQGCREMFAVQLGKQLTGFSPAAEQALQSYAWPGNLRELQSVIKRAVTTAGGSQIELDDLPQKLH